MKLLGIFFALLIGVSAMADSEVCAVWSKRVETLTKSIAEKSEELKNCTERCRDLEVLLIAYDTELRATKNFLAEPFFGCK